MYIEATKRVLIELKVIATQAHRRLIEEVGLPVPNFQPTTIHCHLLAKLRRTPLKTLAFQVSLLAIHPTTRVLPPWVDRILRLVPLSHSYKWKLHTALGPRGVLCPLPQVDFLQFQIHSTLLLGHLRMAALFRLLCVACPDPEALR